MAQWLRVCALALIIPALAIVAISAANDRFESDWRGTLIAQFGPQSDAALERAKLVHLCDVPDIAAQISEACQLSGAARLLIPIGIVAIVLSLATLVALIPLRAFAARNRRILALFRPALLVLLLALTVIVVLDGGLVAGGAYLAESAFTGGVHPFVVFGIGVAVLVAATGVFRSALTMGRLKPTSVKGLVLDRSRDRRLFEAVDDIATRIGASVPDQIVAGLDPTFFVTEGPVKAFDGTYHGRTLFVSIPFIRILSRLELTAVIGHELGHFRGEDTVYSRRFYPVYRGSIEALGVLQASSRGWFGIPLLPPLRILELFFLSFADAERGLSRQRELTADVVGAEAASADQLGVALLKLEAYGAIWGDAYLETSQAIREGRTAGSLSVRFAQMAGLGARRTLFADVDHGQISHPTDSHPRTSERLAALGVDLPAIVDLAMDTRPSPSAFELIEDGEALEADLMEDLEEELEGPGMPAQESSQLDPSAVLRAAAKDDPSIASLIELEEEIRGPDLRPWLRGNQDWVVLADLDVRPHPHPTGFETVVGAGPLPTGEQWLVFGVASARTPLGLRVNAGTRLRLIGRSVREAREAGRTELMLNAGGRITTIRLVGDWPVNHQIGGMLIVPVSDPLVGDDSAFRDRLRTVVGGLSERDKSGGGAPAAG
jgi:Zn-dependent protease with chaperone function